MTIQKIPKEHKARLRKQKTVPVSVKAAVYGGNKAGPMMAAQFYRDVTLYNLYEALLYVENYERTGEYVQGTAERAYNNFFTGAEIPEEATTR